MRIFNRGRGGGRGRGFDARFNIRSGGGRPSYNNSRDLRHRLGGGNRGRNFNTNTTFKRAVQGLVSPSRFNRTNKNATFINRNAPTRGQFGRGRANIRSRLFAVGSTLTSRSAQGRARNLPNFTIVAAAPPIRGTARTRPVRLRRPEGQQRRAPVPSRTIDNSRITVTRGGVSKTIVNDSSEEMQRFQTSMPRNATLPASRPMGGGVMGRNSAGIFASESVDEYVDVDDDDDEPMPMEITPTSAPGNRPRPVRPVITQRLGRANGFRLIVTNLHSSVTQEDVKELFGSVGSSLVATRLIEAGLAEAVYSDKKDAISAYKVYNDRELDGIPMKIQLVDQVDDVKPEPRPDRPDRKPAVLKPVKMAPAKVVPAQSTTNDELQPAAKMKFNKLITSKVPKEGSAMGPQPDRGLITQALFPNKSEPQASNVTFTVKI